MFYRRTGKAWKKCYLLYEVKTDEDKEDESDEGASDPEEEIGVDKVYEWTESLSKLWKRDLEYLDTGQNDDVKKNDVKKEKKKKSSKKMKLSVEDVKINNSNAVLKFKITDPLREKLQATTSEMILGGADLVGRARTGQGKKLVLVLPILKSLINGPAKRKNKNRYGRPHSVLILLPTRELAKQVFADFDAYEGFVALNSCCVYEGSQEIKLKRGADIVVGTPGRIKDHTERHNIATWFLKQDKKTIDLVGNDKIKASNSVRPIALPCNKQSMSRLIPYTISLYSSGGSKICFTKTKDQASQFSGLLPGARALHGDIQQSQRKITLVGFRKGQTGGAGKSGVAIMLYGSRKSGLSSIEKQTGKRFEHVSAPQPNDIAKAVGMEAAEKIIQVCDGVVPAFMMAAEEAADEYGEGDKLLRNCFLRQIVKENDGNSKTQVIGESEIESFEKDEDMVLDQKEFETLYHHEEKSSGDIIMGQSRISEDSAEKNNEDRMKIGQSCVEYENLESFLKLPLEDPCILAHKENESLRIVWRTLGLKIAATYFSSYVVNTCKVLWIVNAKVETFELGKTRVSNLRPRKSDIRTDRRYKRNPRTWADKKENEGSGLRGNELGQVRDQRDLYPDILKQQRLRDVEMQQQRSHETKSNRATNLDRERREHKTIVDERTRSGYPVRQGERICMSYRHTGLCVYETEGKEDFMETNLEKPEDSTKTAKKLLAESKTEKAQKGSTKITTKKRLDKSVHSDAKKRNSEGGSMDMQIAKSLKSKKKNSRTMKSSTKEFEQIIKSHQKRNQTAVEEVEFNKSEHGEELVSKRANIWWSLDKKFYDGIIKSYKRLNKMCQVSYSDGDSEELNFNNLKKERWKIISDEEVSKFSRIHGKFRDVVRSVHSDDEEHEKEDKDAWFDSIEINPMYIGRSAANDTEKKEDGRTKCG
ncbi:unnamed protein product [Brassica oleracea]